MVCLNITIFYLKVKKGLIHWTAINVNLKESIRRVDFLAAHAGPLDSVNLNKHRSDPSGFRFFLPAGRTE